MLPGGEAFYILSFILIYFLLVHPHCMVIFKSVLSNESDAFARARGMGIDKNVALFGERNCSPKDSSSVKTSGAVVTDPDEFKLYLCGTDLNLGLVLGST